MADSPFDPSRVIVLVGATGTGKTGIARRIADQLPVSFVCLDSMQIYGDMSIGTAAPTEEELGDTPHYFFGTFSIRQPMSFARFADVARREIGIIQTAGRIPLLVGGTGLYLRFLFDSFEGLPRTPERLRTRMDKIRNKPNGTKRLYGLLQRLDPQGAARLHPNDVQRVKRFLEVRLLTGKSMLDIWRSQPETPSMAQPIGIGLRMDRDILWPRLKARIDAMLRNGLLEEAKELEAAGLADTVRRLGPIGYDAVFDYHAGKLDRETLKERVFFATRRYAKRQKTWFKKVPYIRWFPYNPQSGYNITDIITWIKSSLN